MSAETLRKAAALMRERAEKVTSGAQWTGNHYWITDYDPSDPTGQTAMQRLIGGMDQPDAEHYSSWHPAVALAVAEWLDAVAARWHGPKCNDPRGCCNNCEYDEEPLHALSVAEAYLGEWSL